MSQGAQVTDEEDAGDTCDLVDAGDESSADTGQAEAALYGRDGRSQQAIGRQTLLEAGDTEKTQHPSRLVESLEPDRAK